MVWKILKIYLEIGLQIRDADITFVSRFGKPHFQSENYDQKKDRIFRRAVDRIMNQYLIPIFLWAANTLEIENKTNQLLRNYIQPDLSTNRDGLFEQRPFYSHRTTIITTGYLPVTCFSTGLHPAAKQTFASL